MADPVYNPDYLPLGRNSRDNDYYKTVNHRKLARIDETRSEFLGTIGGKPVPAPVVNPNP